MHARIHDWHARRKSTVSWSMEISCLDECICARSQCLTRHSTSLAACRMEDRESSAKSLRGSGRCTRYLFAISVVWWKVMDGITQKGSLPSMPCRNMFYKGMHRAEGVPTPYVELKIQIWQHGRPRPEGAPATNVSLQLISRGTHHSEGVPASHAESGPW